MQSTVMPSCTLFHSGDFDGAMYLENVTSGRQHQVVVTRSMLEDMLREQRYQDVIEVEGPDGSVYDRMEVTHPKERNLLRAGSFRTLKLQVNRKDIENLVLKYRTRKIETLSRATINSKLPFAKVMGDLDIICGQLEGLASPPFNPA